MPTETPEPVSKALRAAYDFVEMMVARADGWIHGGSFWHGWALREAFLAGTRYGGAERNVACLNCHGEQPPDTYCVVCGHGVHAGGQRFQVPPSRVAFRKITDTF